MSSKRQRQTMEKFRREQLVKQRRADKLQRKEGARLARTADGVPGEASAADPDSSSEPPSAPSGG